MSYIFQSLLDSYQFKTLHSVLDCTIDEIRPSGDGFEVDITYTHADGEQATLEYESVIRCTGFRMDTSIFDESCAPEMVRDGRLPARRHLQRCRGAQPVSARDQSRHHSCACG